MGIGPSQNNMQAAKAYYRRKYVHGVQFIKEKEPTESKRWAQIKSVELLFQKKYEMNLPHQEELKEQ